MKIAVVGSRALDLELTVGPLFQELLKLPPESEILLRKPKSDPPEAFEALVEQMALAMHYEVRFRSPEGSGRQATFARDMVMVEQAEAVIAFFDPDHIMEGGTGHVVEKAIQEDLPCYAYQVDGGGHTWVGGIEPPEDDAILSGWNRRSGSPIRSSTR